MAVVQSKPLRNATEDVAPNSRWEWHTQISIQPKKITLLMVAFNTYHHRPIAIDKTSILLSSSDPHPETQF
jgi:hypothetical protein